MRTLYRIVIGDWVHYLELKGGRLVEVEVMHVKDTAMTPNADLVIMRPQY